jgi:hypothetical protein
MMIDPVLPSLGALGGSPLIHRNKEGRMGCPGFRTTLAIERVVGPPEIEVAALLIAVQ